MVPPSSRLRRYWVILVSSDRHLRARHRSTTTTSRRAILARCRIRQTWLQADLRRISACTGSGAQPDALSITLLTSSRPSASWTCTNKDPSHVPHHEPLPRPILGQEDCVRGDVEDPRQPSEIRAGLRQLPLDAGRGGGRCATLYASHTLWSEQATPFSTWTKSEAFRAGTQGVRNRRTRCTRARRFWSASTACRRSRRSEHRARTLLRRRGIDVAVSPLSRAQAARPRGTGMNALTRALRSEGGKGLTMVSPPLDLRAAAAWRRHWRRSSCSPSGRRTSSRSTAPSPSRTTPRR
jgi:hypothetical protein